MALSGKRGREIKWIRERDGRGKGGRIIQKVISTENGILTQKKRNSQLYSNGEEI